MLNSIDEGKIDAIFAQLDQCRLPGAAVGIAVGGKPIYRKGFGLASMELPVILSPSTRMRLGSITKQFTCLAYLLFCESDAAGIDDSIGKYLPQLHPIVHNVTVRQLMTHVSGLRDVCDIRMRLSGYGGTPTSCAELLKLYCDMDDVNAIPGTTWLYNNGAYVILSAIVERIAGQPLEQVLRDRIFGPIGMHDTLLRRWDTDFVPNSARPHAALRSGGYETSYWGLDFAGAGGMVSTVDDMLRWLAHMEAPVVGTGATWGAMTIPQTVANGTSTGYGFGLAVSHYRGIQTITHIGGWTGANAQIVKAPACGLDIVVMVNRGDAFAPEFANRILDACIAELDPVRETRASEFISGNYLARATGRIVQLSAKDRQQMVAIDGHDLPYVRDNEGVLRPVPVWRHIKRFVRVAGDPVRPTSVQLDDFGNLEELVQLAPAGAADVRTIVGRYRSSATGTEAAICETEDGPCLRLTGRFGSTSYWLECIADGIWRARSTSTALLSAYIGGILAFDGDETLFRFSTYSTRALVFRRFA